MQAVPSLFIAYSSLGGRGVFTAAPIAEGTLIETCPVLVLPGAEKTFLDQSKLHDYYFIWGHDDEFCALILGFGSLYNHAFSPNAWYQADYENHILDIYALKPIAAGEEITINYSGEPDGRMELWFEDLNGLA
ncbi:MAG TPA: SET domain-containing protein [Saprospiraceae bacterium]|nr:SET domain-containing protein [Saprospiraceae bacterium]